MVVYHEAIESIPIPQNILKKRGNDTHFKKKRNKCNIICVITKYNDKAETKHIPCKNKYE